MYVADTIAAIITPPGPGGVGIIRVSGPLSGAIARRVFSGSKASAAWVSHRLYRGTMQAHDGALLDQGLAVLMRKPKSYTGEDVLELHCHGSPLVLRRLLEHVLSAGARAATPGEFTRRAFLNDRLDLAQAEAVNDLVQARSAASAALAAAQLTGHLSATLDSIRDDLIRLKALLETQIDFSEEDVQISPDELLRTLNSANQAIDRLMATHRHGALLRDGLRVAIIGKPNVGKSSLLNALLGSDRAIVTEMPGTTRDTIEEVVDFAGIPTVLTDTAGLRAEAAAGPVERLGMVRSQAALQDAQVRLVVIDASRKLDAEDCQVLNVVRDLPHIVVLNKIDLLGPQTRLVAALPEGHTVQVQVSATHLLGLDELRSAVMQVAEGDHEPASGAVITNSRHYAALQQAAAALACARESIEATRPADIVAVDVQDGLDHIGSITGAVSSEDVLDRIFRDFCIGK